MEKSKQLSQQSVQRGLYEITSAPLHSTAPVSQDYTNKCRGSCCDSHILPKAALEAPRWQRQGAWLLCFKNKSMVKCCLPTAGFQELENQPEWEGPPTQSPTHKSWFPVWSARLQLSVHKDIKNLSDWGLHTLELTSRKGVWLEGLISHCQEEAVFLLQNRRCSLCN